jgi:hypothetical protein
MRKLIILLIIGGFAISIQAKASRKKATDPDGDTSRMRIHGNLEARYLQSGEGANVLNELLDNALLGGCLGPAFDAGNKDCIHSTCSGGNIDTWWLDTQPKYANSSLPTGNRLADCPAGYTNTGVSCYKAPYGRGAGRIPDKKPCSAWNSAYRDDGTSCWLDTYGRGSGYAIWNEGKCKKENPATGCEKWGAMYYPKCKSGYHNVACCLCEPNGGPGIKVTAFQRYQCRADEELNGALCYPKCNPGYHANGCCICAADNETLSHASSASCGPDETQSLGRCYKCPADREYYGGLCYKKCPAFSKRTAVSTCEFNLKLSGNTHLHVVNQALVLLNKSSDAVARTAAQRMMTPACRTKWEQGLWDMDDDTHKDGNLGEPFSTTGTMGSHFYNASGKDWNGNPTSTITYLMAGVEAGLYVNVNTGKTTLLNARDYSNNALAEINNINDNAQCYALGKALHYLTDVTDPQHSTGFSAFSVPWMLHPMFEFYIPRVQDNFLATNSVWDGLGMDRVPDEAFLEASKRSAILAPALQKSLIPGDGTIVSILVKPALYTGYNFIGDPAVDQQIGIVLNEAYQSTASYIYSVFKTKR